MKDIHLLFVPLIFSNLLHLIIIKKNYLSFLRIPIAASYFGRNKTWRGFFVLTILNSIFFTGYCLLFKSYDPNFWIYGAIIGFAYMIAELPNSYFKRKMGIASGQKGKPAWLYLILDKADSSVAVVLAWSLLYSVSWSNSLMIFLAAFSIHLSLSAAFLLCGLKEAL